MFLTSAESALSARIRICIVCNFFMILWVDDESGMNAYSDRDLMRLLKSIELIFRLLIFILLIFLKREVFFAIFVSIFSRCFLNVSFGSSVIPKKVGCGSSGSQVPFNRRLRL